MTAAAVWLLSNVDLHGTLLCLTAFLLVVVGATRLCSGHTKRLLHLPPGPRGWPIVGNLFQLGDAPHVRLTELSAVYGDVYRLQLGACPAIVVNGWRSVHQALVKQLDDFASRPNFASFEQYADGKSISFQPYTAMFRLHRKLTSRGLHALLSADVAESVVRREAATLVDQWINRVDTGPINPTADVSLSVGGVLYSLCFGQHSNIRDDADYRQFVTETNPSTELFAAGNQVELLPSWIRPFWRRFRRRQFSERMKRLVALNARKRCEHAATASGDGEPTNMLDILMRATRQVDESEKQRVGLTDDHLLSTTIEFISAGTDTSSTTLLWLVLYMAVYPDEQRRIQRDIDAVVSGEGPPTYAECLRIPRAEATIFEVMRLATIVPFALPHCAVADATLDGYDVPRDTLVLINLWSVARDARVWDNVDDFRPDRFLTERSDGCYVVNRQMAHRFLPFSAGRRRCIGEVLARMQVLVIFVTILQKCTIALPEGYVPDLSPEFGDLLKPRPYNVRIVAR